jgi:hypothetical protein
MAEAATKAIFLRQSSSSSVNPTLRVDLVMRNLAVFDMAARLHHFEPANLPHRARRTPDGGLDRVLDALFLKSPRLG